MKQKSNKQNIYLQNHASQTQNTLNMYKSQKGITLIALAVTIVVLLILAGVSLNAVFSQNGIISKALDAQNKMNNAEESDLKAIGDLNQEMENWINGNGGTGKDDGDDTPKPLVTDSSLTSDTRTTTESSTVIAQDTLGNQVVVPGGFKIAADSGSTVKEGIVIEDKDGNQFVWVPVSNINNDGSNKIKVDENTEVEITLGRYTFDTTDGTETLVQKGSEYAETTSTNVADETVNTAFGVAKSTYYYYELSDYRESTQDQTLTSTNTTAKDLKSFIEKTAANKGYYIARYEASYGSGSSTSDWKPLSKVSTANSTSSMSYTKGTLWNCITQGNAAKVCQNMYSGNSYVESDLTNSYAWDTAIVYIQAMGNSNYANQKDGNGTLKNTGETGDEKCKIFDMAGNELEWTTEYCTSTSSSFANPCTGRGGSYDYSNSCTAYRYNYNATRSNNYISFRPSLYVK